MKWCLGGLPWRVEGVCVCVCVCAARGWGQRAETRALGMRARGRALPPSPHSPLPMWGARGSALVSLKGLVGDQCALVFVFCVLQVGPWFGGGGVFLCLSVCAPRERPAVDLLCVWTWIYGYTLGKGCVSVGTGGCVCVWGSWERGA